ncbi:MAG: TetR/AcrR family transcriptional regulator [Xanthobacteraceae bacterium]
MNKVRRGNTREALLEAAERLFSQRGYSAVSLREIASEAQANVGSLTYHFQSKIGLLRAVYTRHCEPMNRRRMELLGEAQRIRDRDERLVAILRAYLLPAFSSSTDSKSGGAVFTRMRAVLSAEGNEDARRIIAEAFDETSHVFIDAIADCLPGAPEAAIVWRSQFLLGSLYYALINPERVTRLSEGRVDGHDMNAAIDEIVSATFASLRSLAEPARAPVPAGI